LASVALVLHQESAATKGRRNTKLPKKGLSNISCVRALVSRALIASNASVLSVYFSCVGTMSYQIKFVLIHEALHCALTHFARRGNRTKHKWDLACDFAINPLLVKEGFHPPIR
jgi:predicted metal-dependent peptidase